MVRQVSVTNYRVVQRKPMKWAGMKCLFEGHNFVLTDSSYLVNIFAPLATDYYFQDDKVRALGSRHASRVSRGAPPLARWVSMYGSIK